MLSVNAAKYAGHYSLQLTFSNGRKGLVHLEETVFSDRRKIFSTLREESQFKDFTIDHSTVVWSHGLDLAPEYLFYLAFKDDEQLQEQFQKWGYVV